MRRIYHLAIFGMALLLGACSPGRKVVGNSGGNAEFRVASYNIRYAAKMDEESGNSWAVRKIPLAELIRNHGFDIVGTQEGNNTQLTDLEPLLPGYSYVKRPYGGNNTGSSHNCAIFYKTALFDILDDGVFWYSETPDVESIGWDATDLRLCQWIKFREKDTKQEFFFFNSHFYWRYQTAKQNSGAVFVKKAREIAGNAPMISTGDFNSGIDSPQIKDILTLLRDSYQIAETVKEGAEGTGFAGGVFEGPPGGRIDFVFVSDQFRVLDYQVLADDYVTPEGATRYPSDHLPVTCKLSLGAPR